MKIQKIIYTQGIIASGKSTWAKEFVKEHQDYKRLNRDDMRHMLSSYTFDNDNEKLIQSLYKLIIPEVLYKGYNLIIDEQNLNEQRLEHQKEWILELFPEIEFEIKQFPISLEEAIERDKKRDFSIGDKSIKGTWFKNEKLLKSMFKENSSIIEYNPNLLNCIIVDIDGTLAIRGDRSPFDYKKVKEDKINAPIRNLVNALGDINFCDTNQRGYFKGALTSIIIFSGREDVCMLETKEWLQTYNIYCEEIHMRKANDHRKDYIVKKEMYNEYIKDKYNVIYVIDDRKQVIDMWRELGLTVLDVAGHTF